MSKWLCVFNGFFGVGRLAQPDVADASKDIGFLAIKFVGIEIAIGIVAMMNLAIIGELCGEPPPRIVIAKPGRLV